MKFMGDNINGIPVDYNSMSIEHVVSQSQIDTGYTENMVGSIGKLILIDKKTNSEELKNLDFKRKIEVLTSKKYPLDSYIAGSDSWGENEIKKRSKMMSYEAYYEVWKI